MRSMTGVGRGVVENEDWRVVAFIKTLNSKGLDISIKSNVNLYEFEFDIRNLIKDHIHRGSVSVIIQLEPKLGKSMLDLDSLARVLQTFKSLAQNLNINLSDDMAFYASLKYVRKSEEEIDEKIKSLINQAVVQALNGVVQSRIEEGGKLKEDLERRIDNIKKDLMNILEKKEEVLERIKSRILEKAKELDLPESNPSVLNEIVFIISRMDIEEEITRFNIHLERFEELLNSDHEVGKKMEFLLQEMHREINTLGNKMPELSHWVVEIKTDIDRLKQQVANLE